MKSMKNAQRYIGLSVTSTSVLCVALNHIKLTGIYERIEKAAEQFSRSANDEIEQVKSRIECYRGASAQVEAENNKTLDNIKTIERQVKKGGEYLIEKFKQLVDRQAKDVLQELQSLKSAAEDSRTFIASHRISVYGNKLCG